MVNKVARRLTDPVAISNYYLVMRQKMRAVHNDGSIDNVGDVITNLRFLNQSWVLGGNYSFVPTADVWLDFTRIINGLPNEVRAELARADENARHVYSHSRFSVLRERIQEFFTPWRIRSLVRFATGEYTNLQYNRIELQVVRGLFFSHFPHVDPNDPTKIRFFRTTEHAEQDRHTTTTLGRYLTEFYSAFYDEAEIRDIAAAFTSGKRRVNIQIIEGSDAIVQAYRDGPRSCMSHAPENYEFRTQPTCVYGDESDIKLAVMRKQGKITARALVWPERGIHSRIYGDATNMRIALQDLGYRHDTFDGAKIAWVELDRRNSNKQVYLVMPYIDAYYPSNDTSSNGGACVRVDYENKQLFICDDAREARSNGWTVLEASITGGYISFTIRHACSCCGQRRADTNTVDGEEICEICLNEFYIWVRDGADPVGMRYRYVPRTTPVAWCLTHECAVVNWQQTPQHAELTHPYYANRLLDLTRQLNMQIETLITDQNPNRSGTMAVTLPEGVARAADVHTNPAITIGSLTLPETRTVGSPTTDNDVVLWIINGFNVRTVTVSRAFLPELLARGATPQRQGIFRINETQLSNVA